MKIKYIGQIQGSNSKHIVSIDGSLTEIVAKRETGYTIIHYDSVRVYLRTDDPLYISIQCGSMHPTPLALITEAITFAKKFKVMLDAVSKAP
jgi:hypothetical protein